MSLYCATSYNNSHDADFVWSNPCDEAPLDTKRGRRCCSCKQMIRVGEPARRVFRHRDANEREQDRGFGDEISLSSWYLCEKCGDVADSLSELNFCYELGGESLQKQIADYRADEEFYKKEELARKARA